MTPGIGHNGGPETAGLSWRRHCWQAARSALLPHLPIEVLRGRVRRAQELGLDYKTYASVRAASGHDVVAFLFRRMRCGWGHGMRVCPPTALRDWPGSRGAGRSR